MRKNLLFDLGGVIVDICRQNCINEFERLGFEDISSYLGDYGQHDFFLKLEEGAISVDEFHTLVHKHLPADVTDAQIDEAFNAFITGIPIERLVALRTLRERGYRTYIISNTNSIMWVGPIRRAFEQEGKDISAYFDGVVTSFEAGCCKPDARIFQICVDEFGIKPEDTLFFDDSEANCSAAAALGFSTCHVPPHSSFMQFINI